MAANTEVTFIITGLKRVLNSAKVQAAVGTLTGAWFAVHYAAADLPPTQRTALWIAFIGAMVVTMREVINGWTQEDVANATPAAPPPVQVNSADSQVIAPTPQQTVDNTTKFIPIQKQ